MSDFDANPEGTEQMNADERDPLEAFTAKYHLVRGAWDADERDPLEAFAQDTEQWGIAYEVTFHGGTDLEHCERAWAGNLCQSKEEAENVSKRVSEALSNMIGVSAVRLFVTRVYAAPF